jgi:flagellar motor switch protein FliM
MTDHTSAALKRIVSAGKDSAGINPRSIQRAFRLALARAASELLNLPLSVIGVKQALRTQEGLENELAGGWLLLRFHSEYGTAAACLDPGLVSAIVQTLTIGEVMAGSPPDRAFTDTDAVMAAPVLEEMFKRACTLVDTPEDVACLTGLEYVNRAETPRALGLGMVNDAYRVFDLTVDLAGGLRQGPLCILLPEIDAAEAEENGETDENGLNLGQASGVMRAELHAMICRVSVPLAEFSDLKAGDLLPLTGARLDQTDVQTIDRASATVGRLGQCGGMRAVRINETGRTLRQDADPAAEFLESSPELQGAGQPVCAPVPGGAGAVLNIPDEELKLANPDQIAAEISQLAGLPDPSGNDRQSS